VEVSDIRRGIQELEAGNWDYAFSATDFPAPIFRAFKRRADGGVEMFFPEHFLTRSQDLPVAFHDAAQFYWGRPYAWIEGRRIFGPRSVPIMVPRWRVQDIDNEDDWVRAEIVASLIMNRQR
jgi:N-acylneuraminate cytidylyltransferase